MGPPGTGQRTEAATDTASEVGRGLPGRRAAGRRGPGTAPGRRRAPRRCPPTARATPPRDGPRRPGSVTSGSAVRRGLRGRLGRGHATRGDAPQAAQVAGPPAGHQQPVRRTTYSSPARAPGVRHLATGVGHRRRVGATGLRAHQHEGDVLAGSAAASSWCRRSASATWPGSRSMPKMPNPPRSWWTEVSLPSVRTTRRSSSGSPGAGRSHARPAPAAAGDARAAWVALLAEVDQHQPRRPVAGVGVARARTGARDQRGLPGVGDVLRACRSSSRSPAAVGAARSRPRPASRRGSRRPPCRSSGRDAEDRHQVRGVAGEDHAVVDEAVQRQGVAL